MVPVITVWMIWLKVRPGPSEGDCLPLWSILASETPEVLCPQRPPGGVPKPRMGQTYPVYEIVAFFFGGGVTRGIPNNNWIG